MAPTIYLASDTTNDVELTAFNDYWGGHLYKTVDFLNYYPASTIPRTNEDQTATVSGCTK